MHQNWMSEGASPVFGSKSSGPDAPLKSTFPVGTPSAVNAGLMPFWPTWIGSPGGISRLIACARLVPVIGLSPSDDAAYASKYVMSYAPAVPKMFGSGFEPNFDT